MDRYLGIYRKICRRSIGPVTNTSVNTMRCPENQQQARYLFQCQSGMQIRQVHTLAIQEPISSTILYDLEVLECGSLRVSSGQLGQLIDVSDTKLGSSI